MPDIKEKILTNVTDAHVSASEWHKKIFDAIKERDSIKTYDAMKQHLMIAKEHAKKMLIVEQIIEDDN